MGRKLIFILVILLILAGCAPSEGVLQSTPTYTISSATTQPTATPMPATPTPSPSPTPTATHTPSPTPIPMVRFAVIGDFGTAGPDLQKVAALIDSWDVDFIVTTGDNNYPLGQAKTIDENIGQYFHSYIGDYQGEYGPGAEVNRFFPTLGNHDWMVVDAKPYLDYFTLPGNERYYDVAWDFVHIFAVDSDWAEPDGINQTSIQAEWLRENMSASTAAWKVVVFHMAPYSSGHHGPTTFMRWPFKEWGADVVLTGHDHHYERIIVGSLPYFVNGLGGGGRYDINQPVEGSQARYRAMHGAMFIEASPTQMTIQFINVAGETIDTFVIEQP